MEYGALAMKEVSYAPWGNKYDWPALDSLTAHKGDISLNVIPWVNLMVKTPTYSRCEYHLNFPTSRNSANSK